MCSKPNPTEFVYLHKFVLERNNHFVSPSLKRKKSNLYLREYTDSFPRQDPGKTQ